MRHIDEDTITQAVIARHAAAGDARLREVMTLLVQHLHAFAREVKLSESEWAAGLRFIAECAHLEGGAGDNDNSGKRQELVLLSDALGLSTLVAALDRRKAKGSTEWTMPATFHADGAAYAAANDERGVGDEPSDEPCYVRGHVRAADGSAVAGAEVRVWPSGVGGEGGLPSVLHSNAEGAFLVRCAVAEAQPIPHDGPVGRLLAALGRHPWRPAHLHFMISAPGHERLVTHVFRKGGQYLDSDALFGVRSSLVVEWVRHEPGRTPEGATSTLPFFTLDFDFVLNPQKASTP